MPAIQVDAGAGDDVIELVRDDENDATLTSVSIQGGAGDDHIEVDSALLGSDSHVYELLGGAGDDRIKLTGKNTSYSGLLLDGGSGDDAILGGKGNDTIRGGAGFDVIAAYDGNDVIEGGDEFDMTSLCTWMLRERRRYRRSTRPMENLSINTTFTADP